MTVENVAPVVTGGVTIAPDPLYEGQPYDVTVPVYDFGSPLTWEVDCTDDGSYDVTATVPPGTLPLTCPGIQDGVYDVRIRVTDPEGAVTNAVTSVTILNLGPAITNIQAMPGAVSQGTPYDVTADVYDFDSPLTYEVDCDGDGSIDVTADVPPDALPLGCNLVLLPGTYPVTLYVTDPQGAQGQATTSVTVLGSDPVVTVPVSVSPSPVTEGLPFEVTVTVTSFNSPLTYDVDCDGDGSIDISADVPPDSLPLVCPGLPEGSYEVTVVVTDPYGAVTSSTSIFVVENSPPVLIEAYTTAAIGEGVTQFTIYVAANDTYDDPLSVDLDCNGDGTLDTFGLSLPLTDATLGCTVLGGFDGPGSYPITGVISDGGAITTFTALLAVNNVPPSVLSVSATPIDAGFNSFDVILAVTDAYDTILDVSIDCDGDGTLDFFNQAHTVTQQTHTCVDLFGYLEGSYTITGVVDDLDGGSVTFYTLLVVNNVAPELTALNVSPNPVTQGFSFEVTLTASDLDSPLTYYVDCDGDNNFEVTATVPPDSLPLVCPGNLGVGSYNVTAAVSDGKTLSVTGPVVLVVVNDTPILTNVIATPSAMTEGTPYTVTGTATDYSATLTYEVDCTDDGSYDVTATVPPDSLPLWCVGQPAGLYTVRLRVTDPHGAVSSATTDITVSDIPPVVIEPVSVSPSPATEGIGFAVTAVVWDFASPLTYYVDCDGDGTRDVTATVPPDSLPLSCGGLPVGAYNVTLEVADPSGNLVTSTVAVTVENVAPVLTNTVASPGVVLAGSPFTVTGTAIDFGTPLTYEVDCNGDGTVDVTTTVPPGALPLVCSIVLAPAVYPVTLYVTDPQGATTFETTSVTVFGDTVAIAVTDASASEIGPDVAWVMVYLSTTNTTGSPIEVTYTVGGSAQNGTDYTALTGSVSIPDGATSATIGIYPLPDTHFESWETVILTLVDTNAPGIGAAGQVTIEIEDAQDQLGGVLARIGVLDGVALEGGVDTASFEIWLDAVNLTGGSLEIYLDTLGGDAQLGVDYTLSGASIANGATSVVVILTALGDGLLEGPETASLRITDTSWPFGGVVVADGFADTATATILDAESAFVGAVVAQVSLTTATILEGGAPGWLEFWLSATNETGGAIEIYYALTGTATSPADYALQPSVVLIADGMTSVVVGIEAYDDDLFEGPETLILAVTGTSYATVGVGAAAEVTGTILDAQSQAATDNVVWVEVSDGDAGEPANGGEYTVYLSRVNNTQSAVRIFYGTGGTATAGADYVALPGYVDILVGTNSAAVALNILDDELLEGYETQSLSLTGTTHGAVSVTAGASATAEILIADDESLAGAVTAYVDLFASQAYEGVGESAWAAIYLSTTNATGGGIEIYYSLAGTAQNGVDYTLLSGVATIGHSAISTTVEIAPIDDDFFEDIETVELAIVGTSSLAVTVGSPFAVTALILDDEADQLGDVTAYVVAVTSVAYEHLLLNGQVAFWLSLTNQTQAAIELSYTVTGSADAGTDYVALPGVVSIGPGAISASVVVEVLDDSLIESVESVVITLTGASHSAVLVSMPLTATVEIEDVETLNAAIAVTSAVAYENPLTVAWVEIYLPSTNTTGQAIEVTYTVGGSALNGTDYTYLSGVASIANGSTSVVLGIEPVDDDLYEGVETVVLTLVGTNAVGVGAVGSVVVEIGDDESEAGANELSVASAASPVFEGSVDPATFYVTLSRANLTTEVVTFSYTLTGTAVEGADYTTSGVAAIMPGAQTAAIEIYALADTHFESWETVILTLTGTNRAAVVVGAMDSALIELEDAQDQLGGVLARIGVLDGVALEGGVDTASFEIWLDAVNLTGGSLEIYLDTLGGDAQLGVDYTLSGASIANGATSVVVILTALGDGLLEGPETASLRITDTSWPFGGVVVADGFADTATATILDAESAFVGAVVAQVSLTTATILEGGAPGWLEFWLSATNETGGAIEIYYALTGTATSPADYALQPSVVLIADGMTSVVVGIEAYDDDLFEGPETLILAVTGTSYATVGVGAAAEVTGTILDAQSQAATDNVVWVEVSDGDAGEPANGGEYTVYLSRVNNTQSAVRIFYGTGGTATAGADYVALPGYVDILVGTNSAAVALNILDDELLEGYETQSLSLTGTTHGAVSVTAGASATAEILIADDESLAGAVTAYVDLFASQAYEGVGESAWAAIYLSTTNATGGGIEIYYSLAGTAQNGVDYTLLSGVATIGHSAISTTVEIAPIDDDFFEDIETVELAIVGTSSLAVTVGSPFAVTALILDDEADHPYSNTITVVASVPYAYEDGSQNGQFTFWLSNTNHTSWPIAVTYALAGTADNGSDYQPLTGVTTIAVGAISATVDVIALADDNLELMETVELTLWEAQHAAVSVTAPSAATVYIVDAEWSSGVTAYVTVVTAVAAEQPLTVGLLEVVLSAVNQTGEPISIWYDVAGTATPDADYVALPGVATIPDGADRVALPILPIVDDFFEGTETVDISLTAVTHPALSLASAPQDAGQVLILDAQSQSVTDNTVTVTASDAYATETGGNVAIFEIALSRTNHTTAPVVIHYALTGTASNGVDYAPLSGVTQIPVGLATTDVVIVPIDDYEVEGLETVILTLTNVLHSAASVGFPNVATAVIDDPEDALNRPQIVSVSLDPSPVAEGRPVTFTVNIAATDTTDTMLTYTVDCDGNGSFFDAVDRVVTAPTANAAIACTVDLNQGDVDVRVQAADGFYVSTVSTVTLSVFNVAPALTVFHTGPVDEGSGTVTLTVVAIDPYESLPGDLTYEFDCDANGIYEVANFTGIQTCNYGPVNQGGLSVFVRVSDDITSTVVETVIPVLNVAPDIVALTLVPNAVPEGSGSFQVDITASDAFDAAVTFEVDCLGDGTFEVTAVAPTAGTAVTCNYADLNGPATYVVIARVIDDVSTSITATAILTVENVLPTLGTINDGPKDEARQDANRTVLITASATDFDALTYSFDCNNDGNYEVGPQAEASYLCAFYGNGPSVFVVGVRAHDDVSYSQAYANVVVRNVGPTPPSIHVPVDGAVVSTTTPTLTVNNAFDPFDDLQYEFVLFYDAALQQSAVTSPLVLEGTGISGWQASPLSENTTYWWRARATDDVGFGPYSAAASFTVNAINDPPSIPQPILPSDGATVLTAQPQLEIVNSVDPEGDAIVYRFELCGVSNCATTFEISANVPELSGGTTYNVQTVLLDGQQYWWRVTAEDEHGAGSLDYSAIFSFTVDLDVANQAPPIPAVTLPVDGSTVAATSVLVAVSSVIDPDGDDVEYRIQIDRSLDFNTAYLQQVQQAGTSHVFAGLADNTWYYARVRSFDDPWQTSLGWSTPVSFFVNSSNDAPNAPLQLDPVDGATVGILQPTLVCSVPSDVDGFVATMRFVVYDDVAGTIVVQDSGPVGVSGAIMSYVVDPALVDLTTYWWDCAATDELGATTTSVTRFSFDVDDGLNLQPSAPTPVTPSNGSVTYETAPILVFANASDADGPYPLAYFLEIANNAGFSGSQVIGPLDEEVAFTTWLAAPALVTDNSYWWRVRAEDGAGVSGAWSSTVSFTVGLPPSAPGQDGDGIPDDVECPNWPLCPDSDGDGIPDYLDPDDDGDGIPTATECPNWPLCPDSDGDGIPDYLEPNNVDTDGDGLPNHLDADDDGDGIPTRTECPSWPCIDSDGDGVPDFLEPNNVDSDGDGFPNHLDADDDGDGIPTSVECTRPFACEDSDGDGIPDYLEPNNVDTDGDGLPNHLDPDDDGDGIPTSVECTRPFACEDSDGDGIPDYLEPNNVDSDGDGIPDHLDPFDDGSDIVHDNEDLCALRPEICSDWMFKDSDGDGILDIHECEPLLQGFGYEACPDTDGDGIPDYLDLDSDNDGISDRDECPNGSLNRDDLSVNMCPDNDGNGIPAFRDASFIDAQWRVYGGGGFFACSATQHGAPDVSPLLALLLPLFACLRRRRVQATQAAIR